MKKIVPIGIVIIVAALTMLVLELLASGSHNKGPIQVKRTDTLVLADLNAQCAQIANGVQQEEAHKELLNVISIYRSFEVIDAAEAARFVSRANVEYARSLIQEFNNWVSNNCNALPSDLETEMVRMRRLPGSDLMLFDYVAALNDYRIARILPARVAHFLNQEFSTSASNGLKNEIDRIRSNNLLDGCSEIQQLVGLTSKLNAFKNFYDEYDPKRSSWFDDEGNSINNYGMGEFYNRYYRPKDKIIYKFYCSDAENVFRTNGYSL